MLDFLKFKELRTIDKKTGEMVYTVSPEYRNRSTKDLMIRGRKFNAVYDERTGYWSTNMNDALDLIDDLVRERANQVKAEHPEYNVVAMTTEYNDQEITRWNNYVEKHLIDSFKVLDQKLIFLDQEPKREDYASKHLSYPLTEGPHDAWDEIVNTLYDEENVHKIEWAIGSIVTGDSKTLQKFMVFYGPAGSGKSTVLKIINKLFKEFCASFVAKDLGSGRNSFASGAFSNYPLVAIQHDGDLSSIEDNSMLNSLISHEEICINEKFKGLYYASIQCFLFMGTNKPVKITDAKSGILRRLIDVSPKGDKSKIPYKRYVTLMNKVNYELGAIACHCRDVYLANPNAYDDYVPISMMGATNDIYSFLQEYYVEFKNQEKMTLYEAYAKYTAYCDASNIRYPYTKTMFKEELKSYYDNYSERSRVDGRQVINVYSGFRFDKFGFDKPQNIGNKPEKEPENKQNWLIFEEQKSLFDELAKDYPAQLTTTKGTPISSWSNVKTTLKELDTKELHYVKVPLNHIVIDFDLKNGDKKDFNLNYEAALQWPETYAELSKSGSGIHLHYLYSGDPTALNCVFADNIEIKVFKGGSSLRRKLTKCNNLPIATISSGLPLRKGGSIVLNEKTLHDSDELRAKILGTLKGNYNIPSHVSGVQFIVHLLDKAYTSGMPYDVSSLKEKVQSFARASHNHASECMKMVDEAHFKSDVDIPSEPVEIKSENGVEKIVFFDIEIYPNLAMIVYKFLGSDECHVLLQPTPQQVRNFIKYPLVGFNNKRYDNIILLAMMQGYSNMELFNLSCKIVRTKGPVQDDKLDMKLAKQISYTDLYDLSSKKQSLKMFEIDYDAHHMEMGIPWDKPVPRDKWVEVAEYCKNDVKATELVWLNRQEDVLARRVLSDISDKTMNDSTNEITTKLILGDNRFPQKNFNYRDLSKPVRYLPQEQIDFLMESFPEMMSAPHGEANSILPYFEGYRFDNGKSYYKGFEVGEGGFVYAKPGMYGRTITFDVASMHPTTMLTEVLFGVIFTQNLRELINARIDLKHKDMESLKKRFNGKLAVYAEQIEKGLFNPKALSGALKIAINSVYGLTAASFNHPFKDPRNKDNIVAKRGALFMIDLKEAIEKIGGFVVHIKTDSIKLLDPTPEQVELVMTMGKRYGYTFEVEHIFEKICLVNDAVYIAKLAEDDPDSPGEWTATGKQFQVPYVFKKLFSHEPIVFNDLCETKSVTTYLYLDRNEELLDEFASNYDLPEGYSTDPKIDTYILKKYKDSITQEDVDQLHNYEFVGKVGKFCPVVSGARGGLLVREKDGKYLTATGAKGYRWLESEYVKLSNLENQIDRSYYDELANDAIDAISKFGDYEWFISNE